ncbi:MAG: Peptidase S24-like [Verrucomicrobiota bacterium]|jgi:hypothetical protein
MKLTQQERDAMAAWMAKKGLTQQAVGKLIKVTHVSVMKWIKGGGIRPAQLALLRPLIAPYMQLDPKRQPTGELAALRTKLLSYTDQHPALIRLHMNMLDQMEEFLREMETEARRAARNSSAPALPHAPVPTLSLVRSQRTTSTLEDVAAGPGSSMIAGLIPAAVKGMEDDQSIQVVTLSGTSMEPTFMDREWLILRKFDGGPIVLGKKAANQENSLKRAYAEIADGSVVVLSQDQGKTITCKRIAYRWQEKTRELWLVADNKSEPGYPRALSAESDLIVYGKVIGRADINSIELT